MEAKKILTFFFMLEYNSTKPG